MIEHWCSIDVTAVLMHFAGSAVVHLFMSRLGQAKGWTNSFRTWRVGRILGLCIVFGSCCCARAAAGACQSQACPLLGHCRVTFVIWWTKIDQNATVLLASRHAWVMKSWCFLVFLNDSKYMFFTFCSWHSPITRCFRLQYVVSSFACAFSQAVSSIFFRIPWDEIFTRTLMSWSVLKSVFWHTINGHSSSSMTQSFTKIAVSFWMDLLELPSWWARHIHWAGWGGFWGNCGRQSRR